MRKRNKYKLDSYYNQSTKMRNLNTEMERIILIKEKKTENQATTNEVTWLNRYNIIIDKQNGKKEYMQMQI